MYLINIKIQIPYKSPGNTITQQEVEFEIHRKEDVYIAIPVLDEKELRLANLPKELKFVYENHKVTSLHGLKDSNLHVMEDIYTALSEVNFKKL